MIKLGRYAACYFFILAVIGCGRYNQLSMQSREKEEVKTVKKSTQTKVSSKLKQTPQTAGVSLRSFVTMLAFLSQVTPTYNANNAKDCPILAIDAFKHFSFYEQLTLDANFNHESLRTFLHKLTSSSYPSELENKCCHLFSEKDIDVSCKGNECSTNCVQCSTDCVHFLNLVKEEARSVIHRTNCEHSQHTHYERLRYDVADPETKGQNTHGELAFYSKHRLVSEVERIKYFYTWGERTEPTSENDEHGRSISQRQLHYKSPQDVFKTIKSNYTDPSKRIEQLQKLATRMLVCTNLKEFCKSHSGAAKHLISAGLEALLVARYEKAKHDTKEFFDKLLLSATRSRRGLNGHRFTHDHRSTHDTHHMENLERVKRHGSILESTHKQKEMVQKMHIKQKRSINRAGRRYGNFRN